MRSLIAIAVASLLIAGALTASEADASIKRFTNIEAQALEPALKALARERDLQLVYRSEVVGAMQTAGAAGELTADEALTSLLSGTGLTYVYLDEKTVTIVPVGAKPKGARDKGDDKTPSLSKAGEPSRFRLAQANEGVTGGAADVNSSNKSAKNAGEQDALTEIIVTAQKREERLQDVPISISVLRGDELDSSTVRDVTDALRSVPGVAISEAQVGGVTQVPIRGVASTLVVGTGSAPTAYYLDSAPFGFSKLALAPDTDAYDLERVEVLRGPQGTLYGASALNGVVRVLTRDANPDAFELKARGSTSSTHDGDWNYRGDMAVNVPIVDGKLAVRAALGYQDLSGWIDKPNQKDANDAERRTVRLKVNAQPTDQLSIGLSAWLSQADYGAPSSGTEERRSSALLDEPMAADFDVYNLKVGYEFAGFSVTSATSYLKYENNFNLSLGGPLVLQTRWTADTRAEEVVFNSTHGGPWRWTAGAIYRESENITGSFIRPLFPAESAGQDASESYAVFGELTRGFLDGRWEVTAGLRHFEDELTTTELSRFDGSPPQQDDGATFTHTAPRFVLTWHPSERMTTYASYGEGFRSGFHQAPAARLAAPSIPPVEPDKLTNYELGAKSSLLNGRLTFETAVYYMDWQDVQQNLLIEISPGLFTAAAINGTSASGMGFDFGAIVTPVDRLELGISFSWNDLAYDTDVSSGGVLLFPKGHRLDNSAEYSAGASADYLFPLGGNGFKGQLSLSANYTSEMGAIGQVGGPGEDMVIGRTSLSIRAPQRWVASLFVDNFTDENGSTTQTPAGNPNWSTRIRPRTVGVQLEYQFD